MSQGISGNVRPTIFNRGTVRRRILGGYMQSGRTASRAVGSHEAFFGKGRWETEQVSSIDNDMGASFENTSLPAVYATGQSSGRGLLDAEDDGEPTVEDPVSGR
uniref:Uncharacterized protein n=1 Tax=Brassica oleracea TaxID=3712 RepID=A0A3P6FQE3_BRAOL|nr:unnamed protein product [Brassica oleracea]